MIQYLIHGMVVSLAAFLIGRDTLSLREIFLITLVAVVIYIVLDLGGTSPPLPPKGGFVPLKTPRGETGVALRPPLIQGWQSHPSNPFLRGGLRGDAVPPGKTQSPPIPGTSVTDRYSLTDTHQSRWMAWPTVSNTLNTNTDQYMVYPGRYASLTLHPGFHDQIHAVGPTRPLAPKNWETCGSLGQRPLAYNGQPLKPNHQSGGANTGAPKTGPNVFDPDRTSIPFESEFPRLTNVVYSGDLIELASGNLVLQRQTNNSQVILRDPLPNIRTNLSKLRLENQVISTGGTASPLPIKYRENINIKHNVLIDNTNQIRWIKYGERIQSHQDGPMYEVFKLFNQHNSESNEYVKYGDTFYIAAGDQPSDKIFLKVEDDQSLSSEATIWAATPFTINLVRPYQSSSLCVCPGETIFP